MATELSDRRYWFVIFLAIVDFCCVLLALERYDRGDILVGTYWLIAGIASSLLGWKWPQIKLKLGMRKDGQSQAENRPNVLPTGEYGKNKERNSSGLFVRNSGYDALNVHIPDVRVGSSAYTLAFPETLSLLCERDHVAFLEAWLEDRTNTLPGLDGGQLHEVMRKTNVDFVKFAILYKSTNFLDYHTDCVIERVNWKPNGLTVRALNPSVERIASNSLYRRVVYSLIVLAVGASIGFSIYRQYRKITIPSTASSDISDTSQTGAYPVTVTDENGAPLKGAEVYFIHRNGVHSSKAVTDGTGIAEVATLSEIVSVFCALDGFSSYYQKDYDPSTPLKIRLKKNPRGGSVIFAEGTGYITGLSGRLNPILDMLGRTYLYAENIAIDGGKAQPVPFVLNVPMTLEDVDGHRVEINIVSIIGSSSLIDYRRLS